MHHVLRLGWRGGVLGGAIILRIRLISIAIVIVYRFIIVWQIWHECFHFVQIDVRQHDFCLFDRRSKPQGTADIAEVGGGG